MKNCRRSVKEQRYIWAALEIWNKLPDKRRADFRALIGRSFEQSRELFLQKFIFPAQDPGAVELYPRLIHDLPEPGKEFFVDETLQTAAVDCYIPVSPVQQLFPSHGADGMVIHADAGQLQILLKIGDDARDAAVDQLTDRHIRSGFKKNDSLNVTCVIALQKFLFIKFHGGG